VIKLVKGELFQKENFFLVLVPSGNVTESWTIHHPIGVTDLDADDWVATRTSEVHYLMARRTSPTATATEALRAKARTEFLLQQKLIVKKDDKLCYGLDGGKTAGKVRNDVLDAADAALKHDRAVAQLEHDRAQQGKPKAAQFRYGYSRDNFLEKEDLVCEQAIRKAFASIDCKKFLDAKAPVTFRTRGGPNADQPQVKCSVVPDGTKDVTAAADTVARAIHQLLTAGPPRVKKAASTGVEPGDPGSTTSEGGAGKTPPPPPGPPPSGTTTGAAATTPPGKKP
jgi:hypothetical protein